MRAARSFWCLTSAGGRTQHCDSLRGLWLRRKVMQGRGSATVGLIGGCTCTCELRYKIYGCCARLHMRTIHPPLQNSRHCNLFQDEAPACSCCHNAPQLPPQYSPQARGLYDGVSLGSTGLTARGDACSIPLPSNGIRAGQWHPWQQLACDRALVPLREVQLALWRQIKSDVKP